MGFQSLSVQCLLSANLSVIWIYFEVAIKVWWRSSIYQIPEDKMEVTLLIQPVKFEIWKFRAFNKWLKWGMLMFKVAFSSISNINQSASNTLLRSVEQPIRIDWVSYKHLWEFPINKKIIPMFPCHIKIKQCLVY